MHYQISESCLSREVGQELVVLDLAGGEYFGLNEIGKDIWLFLEEGAKPLDGVLDLLLERYDVDRDLLRGDVEDLLAKLHAKGLVTGAGS